MFRKSLFFFLILNINSLFASENTQNLQRGAKLYMNYCSGCHSLRYLSYRNLGEDLKIIFANGDLAEKILKDNLVFAKDDIDKAILANIESQAFKRWFGVEPKDLSLVAKERGNLWLHAFFSGFYDDARQPLGVNNTQLPSLAMPNVIATISEDLHLSETELNQAIDDLIIFLDYVADPIRLSRYQTGVYVILFLLLFLLVIYKLNQLINKS